MKRKTFIKSCTITCLGAMSGITLFESCASVKMVNAKLEESNLIIPLSSFEMKNGRQISYKTHVIAYNDQLKYPITIFREQADIYTALLMKCTHQGSELQLFGDHLQCPAHGSEFDRHGSIVSGPADTALRTFPVLIKEKQLIISMK